MNEREFDAFLESVRAGLAVIEIVRMTDDILKRAEAVTCGQEPGRWMPFT